MNIHWHKNPEIQKFCDDMKFAINPDTQDGAIYSYLMFLAMTKRELAMCETVEQVKELYLTRLENLVITIRNNLNAPKP